MKRAESILLFLTLLFLPTQLGRHFWPQFSYIYSLKIDYLSPTIYFWDLLVVFLVLIFILQRKKINVVALNLWLFFILSQLFSLLAYLDYPFNLARGLVRIEQYMVAGMFGVYLASLDLARFKLIIFWSLGLSILGESVLAIAQFLKGATLGLWVLGERTFSLSTPAIAKFDFYGRQFLRPYATFPHPNVLAAYMVISVIILGIFRSLKKAPFFRIVSILAGLTTLLTVSRAAILAGFFEAIVLLGRRWKILFLVLVLILSPILFTRYLAVLNFDNLSLVRREELSGIAFRMWLSSPIFGVGLNNFIPKVADELLVGPSRFLQPVHNIFLLTLAETGVLGMLGLLGLIGYPIFMLFKLRSTNYELRTLLLIWGVIIFLGLFDHYFLTLPQGYRLLFFVWGISLSMLK